MVSDIKIFLTQREKRTAPVVESVMNCITAKCNFLKENIFIHLFSSSYSEADINIKRSDVTRSVIVANIGVCTDDIYHFLNKAFYDSCSKIDNSWQKRKDR